MLKKLIILVFVMLAITIVPVSAGDSMAVNGNFVDGEFIYLEISDEIYAGETAQIIAIFENTGQMDVPVQLKADIYFEEQLLDTIESDVGAVSAGKQVKYYSWPQHQGI